MLFLFAAPIPPAAPPARAVEVGPKVPGARKVPRSTSLPYWESWGIRAVLKDMPGAVVVVEDASPTALERLPASRHIFGGRLRINFGEGTYSTTGTGMVSIPGMVDPNVIRQGGNMLHRIYTIGAGHF